MKKNYSTEKTNSYFKGNYSIIEAEINYSYTVSFFNLIDLSRIEAIRKNSQHKARPTYTAFIAKAVALALQEFPYANRRFYRPFGIFPRRFQKFQSMDIAVASETNIPNNEYVAFIDILRDVEKKSLSEIGEWLYHLRTTTNQNKQWKTFEKLMTSLPLFIGKWLIRLPVYFPRLWSQYRGGAVVISSPAKYGVDGVVAAWASPIGVSFGLVKDRVFAKNGKVEICPSFYLTFNFDRRLMAGAQAAKVLNKIVQILENWPSEELEIPERATEASSSLI